MQASTRVSTTTVHDLPFADDCALNTGTEEDMQRSMELFAAGYTNFGVTVSTAKTVILRQPPPCPYQYVQGSLLDDILLWSGILECLREPSQETESRPSQLPPQHTEAEMAKQDPGHGSLGANRNPQHPHHVVTRATAI
ncbi:unnamed protein product [Schistocephalus solidus]|uniref:Reverse transcriptase domain-containing protein n=1 Tax=Schistocephalus solidus TaxID=70667 RepID=A0A183SWB0_SCHSO|nr:unnamed protein product [Schistocephalus solidus]